MTVPPESLHVGTCCLTGAGRVWRIAQIMPDGRVLYEQRPVRSTDRAWKRRMTKKRPAEALLDREVPCGWTPEGHG